MFFSKYQFIRICISFFCTMVMTNLSFAEPVFKIQVVQEEFALSNLNVKAAKLINNPDGTYVGLEIELKKFAVNELASITENNVGKNMNLILSNRILSTPMIRTPLKEKFIIASISKADALSFIALLNSNKGASKKRVPVLR